MSTYAGLFARRFGILLAEFPPKELPGLDERCRWRPLENRASRIMEGINGGLGR